MSFIEENFWPLFGICFLLFVVTSIIMGRLSKRFFTMGKVRQSFSIFDIEFPSRSSELMKLLRGMDDLPADEAKDAKAALRAHLVWDFFFMLGIYPLIFLLCWKTSMKMVAFGIPLFRTLAWMQLLAWLFDVCENIYLLRKVSKPDTSTSATHKWYLRIVISKWLIALVGFVCAISGLLYFWLTGKYDAASLPWIGGVLAVLVVGLAAMRVAGRKAKPAAAPGVAAAGGAAAMGKKE